MSNMLTTVCIAALAMALLRMLAPEGKLSGQMGLLISCVFVLMAVNTLKGAELDMDVSAYSYADSSGYISFSGEVNKALQEKICTDMKNEIESLLAREGIIAQEIHIIVNISGLYSISISQVELVFTAVDENAQRAAEILRNELGEAITVVIRQGE